MRSVPPSPVILAGFVSLFLAISSGCDRAPVASPSPTSENPAAASLGSAHSAGLPNGDFEAGDFAWDFSNAKDLAKVGVEAMKNGRAGLRIESLVDDQDAAVVSARVPAEPAKAYHLKWNGRVLDGSGTTLFLRFFDRDGNELLREMGRVTTDHGNQWTPGSLRVVAPAGAAELDVLIQRTGNRLPKYLVDLDDFELSSNPILVQAPWPPTYKIRAEQTERLTAADVVGPDGYVYPDWTWAGVPGGIPRMPVVLHLADLGAKDGDNISGLLEQAAAQVSAQGGGAVEIGAGTFYLDEPVVISSDKVAIRGAGADQTKLLFRYHIPTGELRFFRVEDGEELGPASTIEFHTNPRNLVALEMKSGNTTLTQRSRRDHWGNTFSLRIGVDKALETLGEGLHTISGIAEYEDGTKVERSINLRLSRGFSSKALPSQLGAINLVGQGPDGSRLPLVSDTRRGENVIRLAQGHALQAGDRITIVAPASARWRELVGHTPKWGDQAQNIHEVTAVDDGTVTINQPVRTNFLAADGSYVQKVLLISGSGLEGFHLEQEVVPGQPPPGPKHPHTLWYPIDDLWTSGVTFSYAWGCWLTGVNVRNTGRNAAYFPFTKHSEIRDCVFEDSLFKGGGGTGYVGFERSWDGLMEKVQTKGMRHGPNLQWSAAGNVIRNSRFLGSDGQWHAGWTLENLFENNFIDARGTGGSYGHGLYASGPSSGAHGPQGPRNVCYYNDVVARKDCLHMLGGNEGWMILHNRFTTGDGRAIYAKEKSFDHIIDGNVFVLKQAQLPPVVLGADSVGVELVNNAFYGVTPPVVEFVGGQTILLRDEGNTWQEEIPRPAPERPTPAVPSIFQWQRDHTAEIRAAAESRLSKSVVP
ncbi:MAG: hypothetical protein SFU53_15625 [Terrimicrobiaceae bacterium]|nr:hypothetical protein [Terrimicrobiaceae bacterium]